MFKRTLQEIQSATETHLQLGHVPEIRAITAPWHLSRTSSMYLLETAASELGYFPREQSHLLTRDAHDAARLAYDLDNCKDIGLPIDCDPYDEDFFVLVVEYSRKYLDVSFLHIGGYYCAPLGSRRFPEEGEEGSGNVSYFYRYDIGVSNHLKPHVEEKDAARKDLELTIRILMDEMIAYLTESNIKDAVSRVIGIILTGEASTEGMEDMRNFLGETLPEYKAHLLFDIDPRTLGVIGAAHRARQYVTEHAIMNPKDPMLHEEL